MPFSAHVAATFHKETEKAHKVDATSHTWTVTDQIKIVTFCVRTATARSVAITTYTHPLDHTMIIYKN